MELPDDIIELIASKLDYLDIINFNITCKRICNVVNPYIDRYYKKESKDDIVKYTYKDICVYYANFNNDKYVYITGNGKLDGINKIYLYDDGVLKQMTKLYYKDDILLKTIQVEYGAKVYSSDVSIMLLELHDKCFKIGYNTVICYCKYF